MAFKASATKPFNTNEEHHDPSIMVAYTDPTCHNIFLFNITTNLLTMSASSSDEIDPEFVGVSSSLHRFYHRNSSPPEDKYHRRPKAVSYVPILKSFLSANGLLCMVTKRALEHGCAKSEFKIRILNPLTNDSMELPPVQPKNLRVWAGFGFGFEPKSGEHKLFRLSHTREHKSPTTKKNTMSDNESRHRECRPYHVSKSINVVEVLSLKSVNDGWTPVLVDCHHIPWSGSLKPVSLHGALHWLVHQQDKPQPDTNVHHRHYHHDTDSEDENACYSYADHYNNPNNQINYSSLLVARFNLEGDNYQNIVKYTGPPVTGGAGEYDSNGDGPTLMELQGCLSLVVDMGYSVDIWMMKNYGVKESWTKQVSMAVSFSDEPLHVLTVLENGLVVSPRSDQILELYDPTTKTYKIIRLTSEADVAQTVVLQPSLAPV